MVASRGKRRWWFVAGLLAALSISLAATSPAGAVSLDHTITLNSGGVGNDHYSMAPDGTFWATEGYAPGASGGYVKHLDEDGDDLGDGFAISTYYTPSGGPAFYHGRVYIPTDSGGGSADIQSYVTDGGDTDPGYVHAGPNGHHIGGGTTPRVFGGGQMYTARGGQVASFNGNDTIGTNSSFYNWLQIGWGINDSNGAFETCRSGFDPDHECGKFNAGAPPHTLGDFAGPEDVALGNGGFYVAEYQNQWVSFVAIETVNGHTDITPAFAFGQNVLTSPLSMVRTSGDGGGDLYVSDYGTRSIAEFNSGGDYLKSLGFGVHTGDAGKLETCGPGIGACKMGAYVPSRLDLSSDGKQLFAHRYGTQQVDVINLGGTTPAQPDKISLGASPLKVKKGDKTRLSATVKPSSKCPARSVLFQQRDGQGWNNLGGKIKAGGDCKATKSVKVKAKTKFRALSIQTSNNATVKTSSTVTVKLK